MKYKWIFRYINFWPPFVGAGIRVRKMTPDLCHFEVELKLRFWNKNAMGTHFGGSLFSMADPFYVLMLSNNLGHDYAVWDKSSSIRFKKPARGKIIANFYLSQEEIERIKSEADQSDRSEPNFKVCLTDESGEIVAEVEKILSIKHKSKAHKK